MDQVKVRGKYNVKIIILSFMKFLMEWLPSLLWMKSDRLAKKEESTMSKNIRNESNRKKGFRLVRMKKVLQ